MVLSAAIAIAEQNGVSFDEVLQDVRASMITEGETRH